MLMKSKIPTKAYGGATEAQRKLNGLRLPRTWKVMTSTLLLLFTFAIGNVWAELTAHTPGVYEKTTDKGGYGCTLTTVASGANAGTFEVYYFSANSKYGNTTDVYGGGSKQQYRLMCADDDSEYQLINTSSTSAFTNSCDWIEMAYATTGFSKSDYTYSSAFNEFFAIAPNGGNTSNTKTCYIKPKNGDILTLKVSGYVEFAILGADNGSSKYMTITVDGETPTSWKSNTLSRRSVELTTGEHTIVVANVGTSANNFYGFSLKLPSCDDANASIIANTSVYVNDELDLEFSSDNTNSVVYDIKKGGSATSDASVTAGVFKATVAGTYVVTATQAKDASGHCAVDESVTITVNSKTPVSSVSISGDATAYIGIAKTLTATADQAVSEYKWEVDGVDQGVDAASFDFLAAAAGTYSIVCKARNSFNDPGEYIASSAHSITVTKLCGTLVSFTVSGGTSAADLSGILSASATPEVSLTTGSSSKLTVDEVEYTGYKMDKGKYVGVTLTSGSFKAGDVVSFMITTASNMGGGSALYLYDTKTGSNQIATLASSSTGWTDFVLTSATTGVYLYRSNPDNEYPQNPFVAAVKVTRSCTESDDCSISDVTINSEAITPVGKVYSYEVAAASALTEVAVTYSIHPLATAVPASGFTVAVPTAGDPANTQTITVTAEDGTHSDTYTISVSKATAASDVVTLDALAVTGYTLSPTFDAATLAYTITKDYGTADPTTDKVTYTKSEDAQKVEVNYDGTNHKFVVTVTAEDNTTTQDYEITINEAEAKRGLLTVPFSNGAKGAINAAGLEIRVPYIGASEPTVVLANIEYQSGVSGASASMESDKLRITGADSNYDDYTLTFVQLTPSALTLDEEVTFDAVPSYAFAPYGWDSGKGVKFAKKVEDGTPRISSGNTRVYFAIQDCDEVQLTSGSGGARNVNIYVNGVLSSVDKTAASGSAIKLALDNTQANFIAIESNQTGGDGGFTKILVKALAANTLAYDNGAYTTGDPALDLSTLISTYNSDAAITYAVKTDGGTNASISGNNFTATVAGTAVVTATQVASETIRQASVDFNVVVTAGATKYTVTFDAQGGSAVDPQQVTEGGSPVEPTAPTKDEYIFKGWAESAGASVSDVVDVTSFTINAPKIFYAVWEAEPAGIKLLNGDGSINTTNFTTGLTASTVSFDTEDHNCAVFGSTGGSIVGLTGLNKVVAYNATTTQTKVKFVLYNTNGSAKELYLQKVLEGATEAVTETISVPSKERYATLYYTYNSSDLRSFYVTTNSTDVKILQMKVIEDGTLLKRAGEAGYEVNLNQGRVLGAQNVAATFEGFAFTPSSNAKVLNSSELQIKTPLSFTIAAPLTLTVTTSSAKYYVSQNSAEDGTTATAVTAAGEETFDLAVAGTWYIVPSTTSAVKLTNIAFALPKCEEPTITTQPATKQTFDPGDLTATVVAEVSDGGTLSYQWYNASDDSEVSGADEATLTTTTEGTYYVIVTNSKVGFQDNSVKSDEATLAYRDATDATLSALNVSAGTLDPAFDPAVLEYDVYLSEGTVDVPTLTATATMAGYADVVVFNESSFTNYEATSTVTVTSEDHSESNVYIVRFHVDHAIAVLVDVTDDITWDFSKANDGSAATSNLCNEEIFANVAGIVNNGDFESDNLIVTANKFSSGKLQASMIKFHSTVDGVIKVVFSNTSTKDNYRYLVVNGVQTDMGSKSGTAETYYGFVPAGDVVLTVTTADGGNMFNFTSVKFMKKSAPDHARDAAHGDDWMAPGELGTICLEHGAVATGGDIFELVGKNADGKIVFASVSHMTPGKPYLFQAKSNAMNFYYTDEAEASEPDNSGAMKGSFTNYTLNNVANVYYFAGHALWLVDADHLDVIAHRAYVQMDEVGSASAPMPGRRYFAMNVNGHNTPTGVENVQGDNVQRTKVLINGNLYILRGEKMFDATGKLVK